MYIAGILNHMNAILAKSETSTEITQSSIIVWRSNRLRNDLNFNDQNIHEFFSLFFTAGCVHR